MQKSLGQACQLYFTERLRRKEFQGLLHVAAAPVDALLDSSPQRYEQDWIARGEITVMKTVLCSPNVPNAACRSTTLLYASTVPIPLAITTR